MKKARVYLIPAPLYDQEVAMISGYVQDIATSIDHYFVENIRTARRVLKLYSKDVQIDDILFEEVNHKAELNTVIFRKWIQEGHTIGIMSEAGMPALADPGSQLVAIAHEMKAEVVPLSGPSSLFLALAASGMNGQKFRFHGYLPIENAQRIKVFRMMEQTISSDREAQIFIETPYRNQQLAASILQHFSTSVKLCIACDLTAAQQFIHTKTIREWRETSDELALHKRPAIFILG